MGVCELVKDRRHEKQVDEVRIELGSALAGDLQRRRFRATGAPVVAAIGNDVEGVGDGDDSGVERNASPAEAARIAAPVPSFVVGNDSLSQLGIEGREGREHVRATQRMSGDGASLRGRQLRVVVDKVEQRFMNLPDVVEEGNALERAQPVPIETGGVTKDQRIARDPTDVLPGLVVVRFDRIEECLEDCGGEALGAFATTMIEAPERASDEGGDARRIQSHQVWNRKKRGQTPEARRTGVRRASGVRGAGDGLLSRGLATGVPSALSGLTTVFGMGTGVALTLESPAKSVVKHHPPGLTNGGERQIVMNVLHNI